ncbi:MAG: deoxyribonuclease V [Gammaproteobacteria bacterium]|nr:deoxyribonuclease V [Gammaproteobacteria bacterium]
MPAHPSTRHGWQLSASDAIQLQKDLAPEVILEDDLEAIHTVAGVDVGFEERGRITRAAIVVMNFPGLEVLESTVVRCNTLFPYIPGLLSFRELPAVLEALQTLHICPDLFLCDGQGYAHPRRFGIACHLGILTGAASIGIGKSRLIGDYKVPPDRRGAWSPLMDKGECIGAVVRTREKVKPVFVSQGHRISLETAIEYVMRCTTRYKLPETTRWAHRLASNTGRH